jgi:membrane protein YfhO
MALATVALFLGTCLAIAALWNALFERVPWRTALLFVALVAAYECTTLFTTRVDLPASLAFTTYPWQVTGRPAVPSNTGIVFTQIAPWTRVARDAILAGEWPLWNRYSASGSPLLANQQTAIFHPFTLAGVFLLGIGKAFTYTASVRLFTVLFFTFTLLRGMSLCSNAAVYGAIAYAFCSFHIVWLLFPLGLATMMLPVALTAANEFARNGRTAGFALLIAALALSVLGGHPESAFWVWFVTAAFVAFLMVRTPKRMAIAALGFVAAAGLTAFFWMPTVGLLPHVSRTAIMRSTKTNPSNHDLGVEWLEPLLAPNILGTPQTATYAPPQHRHPTVLDDYGEIATGYAGILSLALAGCAVARVRDRRVYFFCALMLFAFFTIAEVPLWRDGVRILPVVGLTMLQRLRVLWALGAAVLAAFAIDQNVGQRDIRVSLGMVWAAVALIYAIRPPMTVPPWTTFAVTTLVAAIAFVVPTRFRISMALTFVELFAVTFRYNPSAAGDSVFPVTGAISALEQSRGLHRFAAIGWSFIPDTPAYYGLEDVKSTDPLDHAVYRRLMRGFLHVTPSYDDIFTDVSEQFLDMLNVRYLYVPPGLGVHDGRFVARYTGRDGAVYENFRAMPRYFVPRGYKVNTAVSHAIASLKDVRDFRDEAVVDHVPSKTATLAPQLMAHAVDELKPSGPGTVAVASYRNNSTSLIVNASSWSLLGSSDTNWPGWRAYVNGERQPTVTVNGAFLGCFVPPGRSIVEFRYWPSEFDLGLRITLLTLLVLGISAIVMTIRRSRSVRSSAPA